MLTTSRKLSTGVDAPEVRNIVLLRPVTSMVEFKQIVGRGTRLFDGKDYFTIYDFVSAYEHFNDPEWDGTPEEPPPPRPTGLRGDDEETPEPDPCHLCGKAPCECEGEPVRIIEVKLADGKARRIDSMFATSFYGPGGQLISSREFLEQLYGELPELFKSEAELRRLWAQPATRRGLLEELADRGYADEQLDNLRKLVGGDDSDLYDVLAHVAYTSDLVPRAARASRTFTEIEKYNPARAAFLRFVIDQYIRDGYRELDDRRLASLLELRYGGTAEAKRALGSVGDIRRLFVEVQEVLYAGGV